MTMTVHCGQICREKKKNESRENGIDLTLYRILLEFTFKQKTHSIGMDELFAFDSTRYNYDIIKNTRNKYIYAHILYMNE